MIEIKKINGTQQMQSAFEIRRRVFVLEQKVNPEEEYDEHETGSQHILAIFNGMPAGTARWRKTDKGIKLERFAVLEEFRGNKVGKELVDAVLEEVINSGSKIYLHAQLQVIPFYEKFGFVAEGEIFEEAGIQHKVMIYIKG